MAALVQEEDEVAKEVGVDAEALADAADRSSMELLTTIWSEEEAEDETGKEAPENESAAAAEMVEDAVGWNSHVQYPNKEEEDWVAEVAPTHCLEVAEEAVERTFSQRLRRSNANRTNHFLSNTINRQK